MVRIRPATGNSEAWDKLPARGVAHGTGDDQCGWQCDDMLLFVGMDRHVVEVHMPGRVHQECQLDVRSVGPHDPTLGISHGLELGLYGWRLRGAPGSRIMRV